MAKQKESWHLAAQSSVKEAEPDRSRTPRPNRNERHKGLGNKEHWESR